jgi:hypothetical protein
MNKPTFKVEDNAKCPCGSGLQFEKCCKSNEHIAEEGLSLLAKKDFPKAEIALRAWLTKYIGYIFKHTLVFIERSGSGDSKLLKIDINAIEEISGCLAVTLQNQGKQNEIVPLFDHIANFVPLPGLAARMTFLKGVFILELTHNEEETKKALTSFKGLIISLDEKLLGFYLELFKGQIFPKEEVSRIEDWIKYLKSFDKYSGPNPFEDYWQCLQRFQKPGGDDVRFRTSEELRKNAVAFIKIANDTYKEIHLLAIAHIVSLELALSCNKKSLSPILRYRYTYMVQLWRRLNDAIAWQMLRRQQHTVRAVCFLARRGPLIECNPNSVIPLLAEIDADPLKVAIWTDSTSAVDVGDILIADLKDGNCTFAEVKDGKVNHEILDLLSKPKSQTEVSLNQFYEQWGKHGIEQIERVIKQHKRNHQVANFIKNEKGFDPTLGKEVEVIDLTSIPDKSWDSELRKCLDTAKADGECLISVDGCLWVWASTNVFNDLESQRKAFVQALRKCNADTVVGLINDSQQNDELPPIISLHEWAYAPMQMPLCCRDISVEHMLEIVSQKTSVLMAFDWIAFGQLLKANAVELNWSSVKEGRREKSRPRKERRFVIADKIVSISKGEAKNFIGSRHLLRIYFDGPRPASVAKQMSLILDIQIKRLAETEGKS